MRSMKFSFTGTRRSGILVKVIPTGKPVFHVGLMQKSSEGYSWKQLMHWNPGLAEIILGKAREYVERLMTTLERAEKEFADIKVDSKFDDGKIADLLLNRDDEELPDNMTIEDLFEGAKREFNIYGTEKLHSKVCKTIVEISSTPNKEWCGGNEDFLQFYLGGEPSEHDDKTLAELREEFSETTDCPFDEKLTEAIVKELRGRVGWKPCHTTFWSDRDLRTGLRPGHQNHKHPKTTMENIVQKEIDTEFEFLDSAKDYQWHREQIKTLIHRIAKNILIKLRNIDES